MKFINFCCYCELIFRCFCHGKLPVCFENIIYIVIYKLGLKTCPWSLYNLLTNLMYLYDPFSVKAKRMVGIYLFTGMLSNRFCENFMKLNMKVKGFLLNKKLIT